MRRSGGSSAPIASGRSQWWGSETWVGLSWATGDFAQQGFRIAAAFDADPAKVGRSLEGISVHSMERLPAVIAEQQIKLGILAVPGSAAGSVAETLVAAGLEGILNFAPVTLNLPPTVRVVSVDLAIELEQLSFAVVNRPSNA